MCHIAQHYDQQPSQGPFFFRKPLPVDEVTLPCFVFNNVPDKEDLLALEGMKNRDTKVSLDLQLYLKLADSANPDASVAILQGPGATRPWAGLSFRAIDITPLVCDLSLATAGRPTHLFRPVFKSLTLAWNIPTLTNHGSGILRLFSQPNTRSTYTRL